MPGKLRVHELAKQLGVTSKELLATLKEQGDSGDLQVGACSGPRGLLGGGPGLARAAFLAPLPARWLHAQITTSPPPLSYAGHLRLAIVSLFVEGSSRRKLTCCSPQAGSFTPSPHWECLGAWAGAGGGR